jgi:hypothetical protein
MMVTLDAAEFLATDPIDRVKKCRALAAEADSLAATASDPKTRDSYLDLKAQWNALADEIEIHGAVAPRSQDAPA